MLSQENVILNFYSIVEVDLFELLSKKKQWSKASENKYIESFVKL